MLAGIRLFNRWVAISLTGLLWLAGSVSAVSAAGMTFEEKQDIANEVTRLFRASRSVISKNQELINNANIADKGLTPSTVIAQALDNYKEATGRDFNMESQDTLKGQVQQAILDASREVMANAQPLINQRGLGFKRFLPAIYARQVAESFNRIMKDKAYIKLTAPRDYLRNRTNRPDNWESNVIENTFRSAAHKKNEPYIESAPYMGRPAYRFILPEYYTKSCLSCHGEPRGERDISGGRKEGGKEGELAGAISFAIFE